jgi:flagellar biosynthesis protein FlhA
MRSSDVLLAVGVVTVLVMMVIPLPGVFLDALLALNLMLSIVVLLTVLFAGESSKFSGFPSLLLLTTIVRLALNVSTTRAILLKGPAMNVNIIKGFGQFVVSGNYVVGIIVFLILVIIQIVVITRGATRTAEVAARFTLDFLPVKSMTIDSDLSAGLITEKEAIEQRASLRQEASFYGAMDGASKFVQGEVRAGLAITAINIVGGLIIGVVFRNEGVGEAAKTYTLLTVGDGLVAQIPSILMSTATGVIITRSAGGHRLGEELTTQLAASPRAVITGAIVLAGLAPIPGFPHVILAALAGLLGFLGWQLRESVKKSLVREDREKAEAVAAERAPEAVEPQLVDTMEVEIGYALIPMVDRSRGGDLLERITNVRRVTAVELGVIVPPIRIRDNMRLEPDSYVIRIQGVDVGQGKLRSDSLLAMKAGETAEEVPGEETVEPAFGTPARWIRPEDRERAERAGYTVVDPPTVIATHLEEVIKSSAADLLGRQEVRNLLDSVKKDYPVVVEDVTGERGLTLGGIQKVLQKLLRENVSIRNLVSILEGISDCAGQGIRDPEVVAEHVRQRLARQITAGLAGLNRKVQAIVADRELEEVLAGSAKVVEGREVSTAPPGLVADVMRKIDAEVASAKKQGIVPVLLCSAETRSLFRNLTERHHPGLSVISYREVAPHVDVEFVGRVAVDLSRYEEEKE